MINMTSQELLPTIIHCLELERVEVLVFEVLKLAGNRQSKIVNLKSNNVFATKPPSHKGSQSCTLDFAAFANSFCGLCMKCILIAQTRPVLPNLKSTI